MQLLTTSKDDPPVLTAKWAQHGVETAYLVQPSSFELEEAPGMLYAPALLQWLDEWVPEDFDGLVVVDAETRSRITDELHWIEQMSANPGVPMLKRQAVTEVGRIITLIRQRRPHCLPAVYGTGRLNEHQSMMERLSTWTAGDMPRLWRACGAAAPSFYSTDARWGDAPITLRKRVITRRMFGGLKPYFPFVTHRWNKYDDEHGSALIADLPAHLQLVMSPCVLDEEIDGLNTAGVVCWHDDFYWGKILWRRRGTGEYLHQGAAFDRMRIEFESEMTAEERDVVVNVDRGVKFKGDQHIEAISAWNTRVVGGFYEIVRQVIASLETAGAAA